MKKTHFNNIRFITTIVLLAVIVFPHLAHAQLDEVAKKLEDQTTATARSARVIGKNLCIIAVALGLGMALWKGNQDHHSGAKHWAGWVVLAVLGGIGWWLVGSNILFG